MTSPLRPPLLLGLLGLLVLPLLACTPEGSASEEAPVAPADGAGRGLVILNPTSERDYFHDFGDLRFGAVERHTFRLKNTDPVPVTIQDLQPSCSCSTPVVRYTDESGQVVRGKLRQKPVLVLPPGVEAEVEIAVDTRHVKLKNVDKLAQVRLRCDSRNTPFITFEMHMVVALAFQATPPELRLDAVPVSNGAHEFTDLIAAVAGSGVEVLGVASATPGLEVEIDDFLVGQERVWRVNAHLQPPLELGAWEGEIVLDASGPGGEGEGLPFHIPVRAQVVEDIVVQPSPLGFQPFSPARGAQARGRLVALTPGQRVKILAGHIEGEVPDGLELSFTPKDPDAQGRAERWDLTLSAPPSYPRQRTQGRVRFELDDPELSEVSAPFVFLGN